jgi:hypothetical protein
MEPTMLRTFALALAAVLLTVPAFAQRQSTPPNPLSAVKAYRCTFTSYGVARWGDEGPTVVAGAEDFSFGISDVDLRRGRSRIVGATASAPATATLSATGLNVIEQTPVGNFILTTIFTVERSADRYFAVHSRHLGDLVTPPSASQFYGTCEVAD